MARHLSAFQHFSVSAFLLLLAATAAAQPLDTVRYVLPEQTVTGTRSEVRWLENPSALSVVTAQDQPVHRALGLAENLLLVPGLAASSRFGTDDMRLAVRGLGARSNSGIRGVRVLYDGIPESEPDGQTRLEGIEASSLDRVELLRGAGSALYGNAAGGVLNLRTAEAFSRTGVRADVQGGGFGFYRLQLAAGTGNGASDSAVTASFDFRNLEFDFDTGKGGEGGILSLSQTRADGWREHSRYEGQIASASWTVRPGPRSSLRSVLYFTHVTADLPGTLTRAQFEADPLQADSTYKALDVGRLTRKGRLGLVYERRWGEQFQLQITPYGALKKLDRARENGKYQAITRYILGGTVQGQWRHDLGERLETSVIAGADQQFQDGPVSFYPNVNGSPGSTLLSQEQERQWGQGGFLQWELATPDRWGVMLGLRYDHIAFFDDFLDTADPTVQYKKDAFTPRVALRYHLRPGIVAFSALHGGFETPTLSETENTLGYDLKPQHTLTVELGLRGEQPLAGLEARWELTGYRMTITDAVVPDEIAGEQLFTNAAEAVHQGVELSARLAREGWGYAGLAASVGEFTFTDYRTGLGDYTNHKLPGVSPDLFSAVIRFMPRPWFFAEVNARASGAAFANTENTEQAAGFAVFGAAIGGRLPLRFVTASWQAGVVNLTDKSYVSFIQANDSHGRYYEAGMPRAVFGGITLGTPGL